MVKEVLIIGGGASGMVTAIIAARNGAKVAIIEQQSEYGKKILATGNGRCNYTNMDMKAEYFYSKNIDFVENFVNEYSTDAILDFFESIGISPRVRDGYVYPRSDQSLAIREALQAEMFRLGVEILWETKVMKIKCGKDSEDTFEIYTNKGNFIASKCILATGGNSGLSKKIEMKGYDLVKDTNHSLTSLSPALVGLKSNEVFFKRLSGIRTDANISICVDGANIKSESGELQLTDYGISGIPVFQISRIAGMALSENKQVSMKIDFVPHLSYEKFICQLESRKSIFIDAKMKNFINGLFKDKLALFLLEKANLTLSTQVCDITEEELERFASLCKNITVDITGINDYSKAQVTAGGVDLSEINDTFESKLHPNLYIIGEVLDVDGICGGYNLHFAWGSGIKAGLSCSQ